MKNHWVWILTGIVTGISLFVYLYYSHFEQFPGLDSIFAYLIVVIVSLISAFLIRRINGFLDNKLSWSDHFILRFELAVLGGMFTIIIAALAGILIGSIFNSSLLDLAFNDLTNEWIKLLILSFFILFIFQATYFSIYSYQQYAVVQINKYASERDQMRLQFDALRSQLSPHFLFNSLNTISSLVHKNPEDAEEFIRRLASTYKYVITNKQERLVSVAEEVEFIKSYYHLLKIRFEDALKLEINLPKSILKSDIPPLTLQILVENAVKHNRIDEMNQLDIYIGSIDNSYLRVSNNKIENTRKVKSFKVGLENIKRRYAYYSEKSINIQDKQIFSVELPVINKQAS